MHISIAMMVLGAIFIFLSYNFSKRTFSWPVMILGLSFILLSRTTESLLLAMQMIHAGPTVAWCIGGLLIGAIVIYAMIELLKNTNPSSTTFGQYMFFGCCKWDDFGEILFVGVIVVGISALTLWQQMSRSWEYARANASVQALATHHVPSDKNSDKTKVASASHRANTAKTKHASAPHSSTHIVKHSTKHAVSHN